MKKYKNLKYISRDRGHQYKSIKGSYIHIADRFHLIMNLSETIIKKIKKVLPHHIDLSKDKNTSEVDKSPVLTESSFSNATNKKMKLIEDIKKYYKMNYNKSEIAKIFKINRKTVRKYIAIKDIRSGAKYSVSNRNPSYLDKYSDVIRELYREKKSIKKVKIELEHQGYKVNYNTLRYYINKYI